MKKLINKIIVMNLIIICLIVFCSCGISEPCVSCGDTPTRAYKNEVTDEMEYYCSKCSSECEFCSNKATKHYTAVLGVIHFVCDDCYEDL